MAALGMRATSLRSCGERLVSASFIDLHERPKATVRVGRGEGGE